MDGRPGAVVVSVMGQGPLRESPPGRRDRAGQATQQSAAGRASGQRRGIATPPPSRRPAGAYPDAAPVVEPGSGRSRRGPDGRNADRRRRSRQREPAVAGPADLGSHVRRPLQRRAPPGARFAGGIVGELLRRAGGRPDAARVWGALIVGIVGALLLGVAGVSDNYLHRGVETSANSPFVIQPIGHAPAANEDLLALAAGERAGVIDEMAGGGLRYVRMPLRWADLEPQPGEYAWDDLETTLTGLETARITPVVTVVDSPGWAFQSGPATDAALDTPPADPTNLYGFIEALMKTFSGRLPFLQIWDAPNDPAHWGGQTPDPVGYATLLGESANAARLSSPGVRIVLAELAVAPTNGPDDLGFLRAVYRSRAADFFDIATTVADGGDRSPFDRQVDPDRINVSRAVLTREVMIEEGDPETPVWATHFGWTTAPGGVSGPEQAQYTVAALQRMRTEWPWMGLAFLWDVTATGSDDPGRALMADGQPTATLEAIGSGAADQTAVAPTGYTPLGAPAVTLVGRWTAQAAEPEYRTSPDVGSTVEIRFDGSGLIANVVYGPNSGDVRVQVDGGPVPGLPDDTGGAGSILDLSNYVAYDASEPIVTGLDPGPHTVTMELVEAGSLTVGGLIVVRDLPTLWPIVVLAVAGALLLFLAIREMLYVLALRRGYLRRRRQIDLNQAGRL